MNNWRLLLLAVVAVLQPIGSFTERNLIDGRQECCDHRSNSFTQDDTRLYGTARKTTQEDRRLNSQGDIREDYRRSNARNDPIRSRERLTVERTERRVSPESTTRFSTDNRITRDQERRQHSVEARESRQTRDDQSRRLRESISRDSLSRFERDALDSRRIRMSRDDNRIGRISNGRVREESVVSRDARKLRDANNFRRVSVNRETVSDRRGKDDVAREKSHRDSRIGTFRAENRLQQDNNRERRDIDLRIKGDSEDRRSRSLESRLNNVERENHRSSFRTISERVDERRQRDQNRQSRARTVASLRGSSDRIFVDRRLDSRDAIERVDQNRRDIREYRTVRLDGQRQQRAENTLSRETTLERRESRQNIERRLSLSRESRILDANVRSESERIVRSYDRTDARKEMTRDNLRAIQDSNNERRQDSRISRMPVTTSNVLRVSESRDERRQLSTRSLDRIRTTPTLERNVRDERDVRYRRNVKSEERLDEGMERNEGTRMSRNRQINMLRESRDKAERRQEARSTVNLSRFEVNARSERGLRLRERDNIRANNRRDREERRPSREQTLNRMARETERRQDGQLSRSSRYAELANSGDRVFKIREEANRERLDGHRAARDENRVRTGLTQRSTRDVSKSLQRSETRRIGSNAQLQRARTLEDIRDERREIRERDESRASRDRISMSRLSRERIEKREARETTRDSRVDARNKIIRSREVRVRSRQKDESRSQDRASRREAREILSARSEERKSRETGSRDVEMRSERLSRTIRRSNERDVRNSAREFKDVESYRESRMMERQVQLNRRNLAIDRLDRRSNSEGRDVRLESLRTVDVVLAKDIRADTRRETRDTRFRSFEAKLREMDPVDSSENQNALTWQMVFYTLQGAYLCGFLMQMLTEKSNKGKSRNIAAWWSSASKDLVKVD